MIIIMITIIIVIKSSLLSSIALLSFDIPPTTKKIHPKPAFQGTGLRVPILETCCSPVGPWNEDALDPTSPIQQRQ